LHACRQWPPVGSLTSTLIIISHLTVRVWRRRGPKIVREIRFGTPSILNRERSIFWLFLGQRPAYERSSITLVTIFSDAPLYRFSAGRRAQWLHVRDFSHPGPAQALPPAITAAGCSAADMAANPAGGYIGCDPVRTRRWVLLPLRGVARPRWLQ